MLYGLGAPLATWAECTERQDLVCNDFSLFSATCETRFQSLVVQCMSKSCHHVCLWRCENWTVFCIVQCSVSNGCLTVKTSLSFPSCTRRRCQLLVTQRPSHQNLWTISWSTSTITTAITITTITTTIAVTAAGYSKIIPSIHWQSTHRIIIVFWFASKVKS